MISKGDGVTAGGRINVHEEALSGLADSLRRHNKTCAADIRDIQEELKALKLFIARTHPEFKKQFPEIRRKVK